jgi:hypothetical protein
MADAAIEGMRPYPVDIEVRSPEKFARLHVVLRLTFAIAIGYVGVSLGWLFFLLYLALPVFAAIAVSDHGGDGFLDRSAPLRRVLGWVVAFYGYMMFVSDRFPTEQPDPCVRLDIRPGGTPTIGSALGRLVTSLPATVVLLLFGCLSGLVTFVAAVAVLLVERYPTSLQAFQRGVLRWQARLLVYHASLVDAYPPFDFEAHLSDRYAP